ncbi:MAG: VCBS repeat-containing protein [Alphaproteobacteria bacterium]|nr:VCBS repeat-containing protein [Alphaproteobacteria bacterium]
MVLLLALAHATDFYGCSLDSWPLAVGTPNPVALADLATTTWSSALPNEGFGAGLAVAPDGTLLILAYGDLGGWFSDPLAGSLYAWDSITPGSFDTSTATMALGLDTHADRDLSVFPGSPPLALVPTTLGGILGFELPLTTGAAPVLTLEDPPQTPSALPRPADVNGDGIPDLCLGLERPAEIAVHLGPFTPGETRHPRSDADLRFVVDTGPTSSVARSILPVGDLDGDGADDLLATWGGYLPAVPGTAPSILPGALLLWTGHTAAGTFPASSATAVVEGSCRSLLTGETRVAGRVGPDPTRTLVGTMGSSTTLNGFPERGALFLMDLAGVSGTVGIADVSTAVIVGEEFAELTYFLPLGDLDADGHDDFAVAQHSPGVVFVFRGPVEGLRETTTADLRIEHGNSSLGQRMAVHDFDGDGVVDLLLGAPHDGIGGEVHSIPGAALLTRLGLPVPPPPDPPVDTGLPDDTGLQDTDPVDTATPDTDLDDTDTPIVPIVVRGGGGCTHADAWADVLAGLSRRR